MVRNSALHVNPFASPVAGSGAHRPPREWPTDGTVNQDARREYSQVFGTENGLTRTALILRSDDLRPFVRYHHAVDAVIADFTCVLMHYPFVRNFPEKVWETVRDGPLSDGGRRGVSQLLGAIEREPESHPEAGRATVRKRRLRSRQWLLVVSPAFRRWVEARPEGAGQEGRAAP